jgi:hypothetical protein
VTRPSSGVVNEDVWESVEPAVPFDADYDDAAGIYVAAVTEPAELINTWVRDTDDAIGWSLFFDPQGAPAEALPWLAQFVGVRLTGGLTVQQQRDQIERRPNLDRGTRAGMAADAQALLTDSKLVLINERAGGDPYEVEVYTLTAETPDPDAVEVVVRAQKPAGLILTYNDVTGITWNATSTTWTTVPAGAEWNNADQNYSI